MSQEGLNGLFGLLRYLCEICSVKFLELRIHRKLFSDLLLPPSLDAPSEWFYSTCFLRWQSVCLLTSIMGLNPLKITSLDSLAAFVKPTKISHWIILLSSDRLCYFWRRSHSCLPGGFTPSAEPAPADVRRCQQQHQELSGGWSLLLAQQAPAPGCWRHGGCKLPGSWGQLLL